MGFEGGGVHAEKMAIEGHHPKQIREKGEVTTRKNILVTL